MLTIKDWYETEDDDFYYKITVYDSEENTIACEIATTDEEKDDIIETHYTINDEAAYYEVIESKIVEKVLKNK